MLGSNNGLNDDHEPECLNEPINECDEPPLFLSDVRLRNDISDPCLVKCPRSAGGSRVAVLCPIVDICVDDLFLGRNVDGRVVVVAGSDAGTDGLSENSMMLINGK